ncbi:MAG: ATP-binding protein, partial [Candidatus Magasanikbacteria bacterium]|nr:ATP-binding protein [Candidatus Magasanikbacteria bacterium]
NAINVDVRLEGDELVIDVIDDGVGMNQDQLDPSGEKYIFGKGVKSSSTGSTGIGLAEFPKRLDRYARGKVFVWSHKREDPDSEVAIFPENTENIPVVKNLTVNNQSVPASTVFEIRLPISKH